MESSTPCKGLSDISPGDIFKESSGEWVVIPVIALVSGETLLGISTLRIPDESEE